MRAEEARKYLEKLGVHVSMRTFDRWAREGRIPYRQPGGERGDRFFSASDLEAVARKQTGIRK